MKKIRSNNILSFFCCLCGVCVLFFIVTRFVRIITVEGNSMNPTLKNGEIHLINIVDFSYAREEIIVLYKNDKRLIKRIIGVPNDSIKLSKEGIYINGWKLDPYEYTGESKEIILEKSQYFVIGDNYQNSYDSREFGYITEDEIFGTLIK